MKPHTEVEMLKLASRFRLYAILYGKGADVLDQFCQLAEATSEQAKLEAMWPSKLSATLLRSFSLELALKSVRTFISTQKFRRIHDLKELFDSIEYETSGKFADSIVARSNLTRDQITQFVNRHANLFIMMRYPDSGDWLISIPDMAVLLELRQVLVDIAQDLDVQSGAAGMLQADQSQVTPTELQEILKQLRG